MERSVIEQLRNQLTQEREDLTSQLTDMGVDPETGDPDNASFDRGFADSGQATAEKARLLSIAEGLVDTLREVNAALRRMDEGTFGACESCGKAIAEERLEARPFARQCMDCMRKSA